MNKPTQYSDVRPFIEWLDRNNLLLSDDYDHMGAFNAGLQPDERGHLPDTYKLPNHITYSNESKYAQQKGAPPAGRWEENPKGGWNFYASLQNIRNAGGPEKLMQYFKTYEPDSTLIFPKGK